MKFQPSYSFAYTPFPHEKKNLTGFWTWVGPSGVFVIAKVSAGLFNDFKEILGSLGSLVVFEV